MKVVLLLLQKYNLIQIMTLLQITNNQLAPEKKIEKLNNL